MFCRKIRKRNNILKEVFHGERTIRRTFSKKELK